MKHLVLVCLSLMFVSLGTMAAGSVVAPRFVVPFVKTPPRIDGAIESAEWANTAGISGFVNLSGKTLDSRRMEAYIGYDEKNLYMAMRVAYYPVGKKPGSYWNRRDVFPPAGMGEDRLEILLDPHYGRLSRDDGYFMIFLNAGGNIVFDQRVVASDGAQRDWDTQSKSASRLTDKAWETEIAIPFSDLGVKSPKNNDRWLLHLSRYWSDFVRWTTLSPAQLSNGIAAPFGAATIVFSDSAPGYRIDFRQPLEKVAVKAELHSSSAETAEFEVKLYAGNKLVRDESKNIEIKGSGRAELELGNVPADKNLLKITLKSGKTELYKADIPFLKKDKLPQVVADTRERKFVFMCRYLPYFQKAWIDVLDFSACAEAAGADSAVFQVMLEGNELFSKKLPLDSAVAENLEIMLPGVITQNGNYRFVLKLFKSGRELVSDYFDYEFINFPFVGSKAGTSVEIFPGFEAIEWANKQVRTVCSTMTVGNNGLFQQMLATQNDPTVGNRTEALLAAPMSVSGIVEGKKAVMTDGENLLTAEQSPARLELDGTAQIGSIKTEITNVIEQDGLSWINLTLKPDKKTRIESLVLDIPIHTSRATLMHVTGLDGTFGAVAESEGLVWDSRRHKFQGGGSSNFKPMIWIGNEDMGLTWCAETNRHWALNDRLPVQEIIREKDRVVLRVHFVNKLLELDNPRTFTFGIQPTPTKPLPEGWRSWLVSANPELPNIKSVLYSADLGVAAFDFHAWECVYIPYPADYQIAAESMDKFRNRGYTFLRYQIIDWVSRMIKSPEGRVYRGEWERIHASSYAKSFQDYKAYYYDKYLKNVGFFTVYEDETYLRPLRDLAQDAGYLRSEGEIEPEYGILSLRETIKRNVGVWVENEMPNMYALHCTKHPMTPCNSFAAISIDGEQRFLDNPNRSYLDNFPLDYIRAHLMGRQFGMVPVFLSEVRLSAKQFGGEVVRKANRSLAAMLLLHDIIGWYAWNVHIPTRDMLHRSKSDFNLGDPDVSFHPYWATGEYALLKTSSDNIKASCWRRGDELYIVAVNLGDDAEADISFITKNLGFTPGKAVDYETQLPYPVSGNSIKVPVPRHDFRIIFAGKTSIPKITAKAVAPEKINPDVRKTPSFAAEIKRPQVKDDLLFHASFDQDLNAKSALGEGTGKRAGNKHFLPGISGKAVVIGNEALSSLVYPIKNNLIPAEGSVSFWISPVDYKIPALAERGIYQLFQISSGKIKGIWGVQIPRSRNKSSVLMYSVGFAGRDNWYLSTDIRNWKNGEWHHLAFTWDTEKVKFYLDGAVVGSKLLSVPYTDTEFEDKHFRIAREGALPGNEQTAVDELRIFSRKLTDKEIIAEYQAVMDRIQ